MRALFASSLPSCLPLSVPFPIFFFFKPVSAALACLLNRADAGQPSVTLQSRRIDVFQYEVNTKQNNTLIL